ncbi:unnamed protein product [Mortierella alpina]
MISKDKALHSQEPAAHAASSAQRHHTRQQQQQQQQPDSNTRTNTSTSTSASSSRPRSSSVSSERSSRRASRRHHNHHPHNDAFHRPKASSAKTTPMHDDSDAGRLIPVNQPALAIDYLGSGWKNEDDIAASWKFMTKQKNDLINGLRLENASWRNWAKQRHNLKTISPKVLNWLKDSDTTWLYGPLYKAAIDEFDLKRFGTSTTALLPGLQADSTASAPTTPPASSTTSSIDVGAGAGAMLKPRLKPALKHKTASEIFKADTLFHVQSDLKLKRRFGAQSKALESAVFKELRQPKLRFNDSVEQCVAIDTDAIYEEDEGEDSEHFVDDDDERAGLNARHEDEDGGILMRISAKTQPRSIVRIDPTTLKAASSYGTDEYPDLDELEDATDDDEDHEVEMGEEEEEEEEVEDERENEEASVENDEDDEEYDDFEEGMFDEPIYLGNPYSDADSGYVASQHYGYHPNGVGSTSSNYSLQEQDVAMAEVSYTRPTPPASTAPATSSSSTLSNSKEKRLSVVGQGIVATSVATAAPAATTIATTTTAVTTTTAPAAPADPTRPVSEMEAEKALMAANPGGFQQRAADLVTNVKDLVSWASSFVYNSSTF